MIDLQITPHFWLREFLRSREAAMMERAIEPTLDEINNLTRLCKTALEPARMALGKVFSIDSGLRPVWLNTVTPGAVPTSYHILGCAADVIVAGMQPKVFSKWLAIKMKEQPEEYIIDKVIDEYEQWTHVQIPKPGEPPRHQYLLARHVKGEIVYTTGEL